MALFGLSFRKALVGTGWVFIAMASVEETDQLHVLSSQPFLYAHYCVKLYM